VTTTILANRQVWRRAEPLAKESNLSDAEVAAVKRALRFLFVRLAGGAKLAAALRVSRQTVTRVLGPDGRPSATMVLRVARLASVSVESLLRGDFPSETACPHCGRT
jgi:hypothetical protein